MAEIKKIALFLPSLHGGGAERVMVALANGISSRGYKVDLVLFNAEGSYLKDVNASVNVVSLGVSRAIFGVLKLAKYLKGEKPTVLLSAMNYMNVVALLAREVALSDTKVIVSEHSTLSVAMVKSQFSIRIFLPRLMSFFYKKADVVVAVSEGVANDLATTIHFDSKKIEVIYNPVVSSEVIEQSKEAAGHPWMDAPGCQTVLSVGRFVPAKDFFTLIKAFNSLIKAGLDIRLVILGEGEQRKDLERLITQLNLNDKIILPGFVKNPFSWMRKASLFVLSSAWEGLPTALIEAMACGSRVVSTNCPSGPFEILEGGRWGHLVAVGDHVALAETMRAALNSHTAPDVTIRANEFSTVKAIDAYCLLMGRLI